MFSDVNHPPSLCMREKCPTSHLCIILFVYTSVCLSVRSSVRPFLSLSLSLCNVLFSVLSLSIDFGLISDFPLFVWFGFRENRTEDRRLTVQKLLLDSISLGQNLLRASILGFAI